LQWLNPRGYGSSWTFQRKTNCNFWRGLQKTICNRRIIRRLSFSLYKIGNSILSSCRGIRWFRPHFFRPELLISNSITSILGIQWKRINKIHSLWKTNYVPIKQSGLNIFLRIRRIRCPWSRRHFFPLISLDFTSFERQIRNLNKLWGIPFFGTY